MKRSPGIERIHASVAGRTMCDETGFDSVQSHLILTFPRSNDLLLSVSSD
jgi:hypothetical protein